MIHKPSPVKIDRELFLLLSRYALKQQALSEAPRRINIEEGDLEATDGKVALRTKLVTGFPLPKSAQIFPHGYEPPEGMKGYIKPKATKAKTLNLLPEVPGSDLYNRNGFKSASQITMVGECYIIRLPLVALTSLADFCRVNSRFELPQPTHASLNLFLSQTSLTIFQRWQSGSRLVIPCLHNADPIGNQYLVTISAAQIALLCDTAMLLGWGEVEFLEWAIATPDGWNGSYSAQGFPGLNRPFRFKLGISSKWSNIFSDCEVIMSGLKLAEDSIIEMSTPQFPIQMTNQGVDVHRNLAARH